MIKVILEFSLVFPYKTSIGVLGEFCSLWESTLLYGGTKKRAAIISMPVKHFKSIFGTNPKEGSYNVPQGMGHFIETVNVTKVLVK